MISLPLPARSRYVVTGAQGHVRAERVCVMEWHTVMTPTRRLTPFGIISFLSCAAFVVVSGLPADAGQKPAPSQDPFVRMNESIDALTKKVWPSVVQVLVSSYGPREDSGADRGDGNVVVGRRQATGSGFVIDADGYIITNAHVVSGARRVQIVLPADSADGALQNRAIRADLPPDGPNRRHHHRTGSRLVEGGRTEAAGAAAGDVLPGAAGRDGLRVRKPDRHAQQPHARPGLRSGPTDRP